MNRFAIPDYSSSPASTPGAAARSRRPLETNTPDLASTTPLAPPPSHVFGSSKAGTGVGKLRFNQNTRDLPQPDRFAGSKASQSIYDEDMEEDEDYTQYTEDRPLPAQNFPVKSLMRFDQSEQSKRPNKSLRRSSNRMPQYSLLPRTGNETCIPGFARDLKRRVKPAELETDADDIIIQTEELMRSMQEEAQQLNQSDLDSLLAEVARELEALWEGTTSGRRRRRDEGLSIGPGPGATPFEQARYVAILTLRLHNASKIQEDDAGAMCMPQILLDWLNDYHITIQTAFDQVTSHRPNAAANELFWDVVEHLIARGKFEDAIQLLGEADFKYAKFDNGVDLLDAEYTGTQLQAIESAVLHLRQVLQESPCVHNADWHIDGTDWIAYRNDVEYAIEELRDSTNIHDDSELLEAETDDHLVQAGKGLPFEIFEHLHTIYHIILGSSADLIGMANDWLEASMLLTIWWNGNPDSKIQQWSFDVSRAHLPDQELNNGVQAYLQRLKESFLAVTDPASKETIWQPESRSPLELAVGLVLQGDMASALAMTQILSLPVTAALAELGSISGWLNSAAVPDGLDKDDLMILTNGASNTIITKDDILELYSQELFKRGELQFGRSGWEFAISIISRCDSKALASRTVRGYIEELEVTTLERAQRLVTLCGDLGMPEEARQISEEYGDYLANVGTDYGTALLCYARSRAENKLRSIIDILTSHCLIQSKAVPEDKDMDAALSRLVSDPKQALSEIAEQDPQAVEALQYYLVGYACVRRYYSTRDSSSTSSQTHQKKVAAKALIAAVSSAADCIYGGLYDPERESAIQVDCLMTLLAEATALTATHNDNIRVFTADQLYTLLAAIEDLQTVNDRVYLAIEECFKATLRTAHGSHPPSPHEMLKKSISSGTNSNFSFSMMGSEMLAQSSESLGGKSTGSAVLVGKQNGTNGVVKDDTVRGWDWRDLFQDRNTTGADVLNYLRRQIASELAMANLEDGGY